MNTQEIFKKTELGLMSMLVLVLPIFVVNSFANVIETPKTILLVVVLLAVLVLKAIRALMDSTISFTSSQFDIPAFLLAAIYILSAVLQTPNKMEAIFLPGNTTVVVSSVVAYFIINQFNKSEKKILQASLFISGVVYSLFVLLVSAGISKAIPQLPLFMQSSNFSPLGSQLSGLIVLASIVPVGIFAIINNKDIAHKALYGVSLGLIAFAAILSLSVFIPGSENQVKFPDMVTSWYVASDAVKENPLFGAGPGNYLTAFNRFRPITYNASDLWSVRYTNGRSYLFTLITEVGIAGLAAFSLILLAVFRLFKKHKKISAETVSILVMSISLLIFPSSIVVLLFFFILLSLAEIEMTNESLFSYTNKSSKLPVVVTTLPVFILVAAIGYYLFNISMADARYKSSLEIYAKGDGSAAYDEMQLAIQANPYVDRYRVSYAQLNLALANALASQKDLTEEQKQTVATLVQQAIREGKVAVSLNPQRSSNWEVLASIYRAVAPLAEGADQFAAQTYAQAIRLDPYNPVTRISLGGIFYAAKDYKSAIREFEYAVQTKPDYANARYNLAIAYKENGEIDKAIDQMSQVLSLVDKDSEDFTLASKTLEELKENKKSADTSGSTSNLVAPQEVEPNTESQIELTEDAQPPVEEEAVEESETSTPTATPTTNP